MATLSPLIRRWLFEQFDDDDSPAHDMTFPQLMAACALAHPELFTPQLRRAYRLPESNVIPFPQR